MNTEPASLPSREAELRTQRSQAELGNEEAELGNEENAPARQAGSTDWLDQVDFVVKTFLRPQALLRLLNSILEFYPQVHVTIADDGNLRESTDVDSRACCRLIDAIDNFTLHTLPFAAGVTPGRNLLVDKTHRPYLLLFDDDFCITAETKIERFLERLQSDVELGVIAGACTDVVEEERRPRNSGGTLRIEGDTLFVDSTGWRDRELELRDYVPHFALIRREVFRDVKWEGRLGAEHYDFCLQLQRSRWKVAQDLSVQIDHYHFTPTLSGYAEHRFNYAEAQQWLLRKWNLRRIIQDGQLIVEQVGCVKPLLGDDTPAAGVARTIDTQGTNSDRSHFDVLQSAAHGDAPTHPQGPILFESVPVCGSPAGRPLPVKDISYFEHGRPEVVALIPATARRVLDVGCGAGRLGALLKDRQPAHVVGIEQQPEAAALARERLDEVIERSVEDTELEFPAESFDCVVCADVLEHLREPADTLERIRRWLAPDGVLVASLPNVRHHSVVSSLLSGNWTYETAGLLDSDHVRFFTRREIEKLMFRKGFEIETLHAKPGPGHAEWEQAGRPGAVQVGALHVSGLDPAEAEEFFTYQYLVVARPVGCVKPLLGDDTPAVEFAHTLPPLGRGGRGGSLGQDEDCKLRIANCKLQIEVNPASGCLPRSVSAYLQKLVRDFPWPVVKPNVPTPTDHFGWFNESPRALLRNELSSETRLVVELGAWLGLSTRFMADLAPHAHVITIDHFEGSREHRETPAWASMLPTLFETFQAMNWEYRERIIPLKMTTLEGLRAFARYGLKPDVIFIDADHAYESVRADLQLCHDLFPNARIVGDDYDYPDVKQAVDEFAERQTYRVEPVGTGWRSWRLLKNVRPAFSREAQPSAMFPAGKKSAVGVGCVKPLLGDDTPAVEFAHTLPPLGRGDQGGALGTDEDCKLKIANCKLKIEENPASGCLPLSVSPCPQAPEPHPRGPILFESVPVRGSPSSILHPRSSSTPSLTSIVIVTLNQLAYTKECVDSIRIRTDEPYELVFVDNGSTDGTADYLRSLAHSVGWTSVHANDQTGCQTSRSTRGLKSTRLVENPDNRGFPAAVNQALQIARGEYVILLNNDTVVTTGWLRRMLDALDSDPQIGLVGPCSNCVSGAQMVPVSYQDMASLDGFAWDWGKRHHGVVEDSDRLIGFCLGLKRAVIDQIGLFDERFGIGCFEDDDFCLRALRAGWRAVIARAAFVHHYGNRTFQGSGIDLGTLLDVNRQKFLDKWNNNTSAFSREAQPSAMFPAGKKSNVGVGCVKPLSGADAPAVDVAYAHEPQVTNNDRSVFDEFESAASEDASTYPRTHVPGSPPVFRLTSSPTGGLLLQLAPEATGDVAVSILHPPSSILPRLSLCMIVRDNENTIGPCLESIRPYVDEIVVVDTGSKDRTPEICRQYGARLFEFPWCDDFSAARNESLKHARGEWIFWMDSDDTISPDCGKKLRDLVDHIILPLPLGEGRGEGDRDNVLGYVMQVHCPGPGDDGQFDVTVVDHVKLIRNRPNLRFSGRIHEQLLPAIRRAGGDVAWTDIHVRHSGSDHSPKGWQRKLDRDLRILHRELQDTPNHPFVLFNLGMTYADAANHLPRLARGGQGGSDVGCVKPLLGDDTPAVGAARAPGPRMADGSVVSVLSLAREGQGGAGVGCVKPLLGDDAPAVDVTRVPGPRASEDSVTRNDLYDKAIEYLQRCLAISTPDESHLRKAYSLLVSSLSQAERHDEAWIICQHGLALYPDDKELLFRLAILHHHFGRLHAAEQTYLRVLNEQEERHFTSVDRGLAGYKARHNLAIVYDELGQLEQAEQQWRIISQEVPNYVAAWRGLGDVLLRQSKLAAVEELINRLSSHHGNLRQESLILQGRLAAACGDIRGAVTKLIAADSESQSDLEPLRVLCRILFEQADPAAAESALQELCARDPGDASAHHNLGVVYLRRHNRQAAAQSLRRSLELRPDAPATRQQLEYVLQV